MILRFDLTNNYLHLYQHHFELSIRQYPNDRNHKPYVTWFFHLKHCLYPNPKIHKYKFKILLNVCN